MEPFLKWAGGKRWLAPKIPTEIFRQCNEYFEPFAGSAATYFWHRPQNATLNDLNHKLITTYKAVRDIPSDVFAALQRHDRSHSDDYYYTERARERRANHERAAQFIYLNRTCWNGLYRENLRGEFNVPRGTKDKVIWEHSFADYSQALSGVKLLNEDFQSVMDQAARGALVFCDPPYTTAHNLNGFVKYNQKIFSWEDQIRLRDSIEAADKRGVRFIVTNAAHQSIKDLYQGFAQIELSRSSIISGKEAGRTRTSELIITNVGQLKEYLRPLA